MLRLTLAQARANAARYVASGSAILIAVAFVVATLVLGSTTSASVTNSLAGQYRTSAVVVDGLAEVVEPSTSVATTNATAIRMADPEST